MAWIRLRRLVSRARRSGIRVRSSSMVMSCSENAVIIRAIMAVVLVSAASSRVFGDGRVGGAGGVQAFVDLGGDQRGVGDQRGDVVPDDPVEVVGPDRVVGADPPTGVAVVVRAQAPVVEDLLVG